MAFLTDSGEKVRSPTELITPEAEHVLDWFRITMRLTALEQYARGVAHHGQADDWRDLNRANWDERVAVHLRSAEYDLAPLRAGQGRLGAVEETELGAVPTRRTPCISRGLQVPGATKRRHAMGLIPCSHTSS